MGSFQTVELIETFLNYQVRSAVVNQGYLSPEIVKFLCYSSDGLLDVRASLVLSLGTDAM